MTNAAGFFSTAVSEMRRCDRSAARRHPATSGPRPAPTTKMVLRDGERFESASAQREGARRWREQTTHVTRSCGLSRSAR